MPLIQCTGGVLPKLSKPCQRTSFLWYSHPTKATRKTVLKVCRSRKSSSKIPTIDWSVMVGVSQCSAYVAVIFSQGAHSSSGKMLHEQWCLGTSLQWSQYTSMLHHAHPWYPCVKPTIRARLAGRTAQGFQRQRTLFRPRISADEKGWNILHAGNMIHFFFTFRWTGARQAAPHFDFHGQRTKRKSSCSVPRCSQAKQLEIPGILISRIRMDQD